MALSMPVTSHVVSLCEFAKFAWYAWTHSSEISKPLLNVHVTNVLNEQDCVWSVNWPLTGAVNEITLQSEPIKDVIWLLFSNCVGHFCHALAPLSKVNDWIKCTITFIQHYLQFASNINRCLCVLCKLFDVNLMCLINYCFR